MKSGVHNFENAVDPEGIYVLFQNPLILGGSLGFVRCSFNKWKRQLQVCIISLVDASLAGRFRDKGARRLGQNANQNQLPISPPMAVVALRMIASSTYPIIGIKSGMISSGDITYAAPIAKPIP